MATCHGGRRPGGLPVRRRGGPGPYLRMSLAVRVAQATRRVPPQRGTRACPRGRPCCPEVDHPEIAAERSRRCWAHRSDGQECGTRRCAGSAAYARMDVSPSRPVVHSEAMGRSAYTSAMSSNDRHKVKPVHERDPRGSRDRHIVLALQTTAGNAAVARLIANAQSPFVLKGRAEAMVQRDDMDDPRFGPNAFGRPEPVKPNKTDGTCAQPDDITEAEDWIIEHESGWQPTAKNPNSSAFGLGQLLKATRVKYLGAKADSTDCDDQIRAFRAYVKDAYGTAERAKQFWQATSAKDATKAPKRLQGKAKIWIKNGWVGY
jgi:hypothetical protein